MRSERRFGWFKFHRQILSDPIICKDAHHLALFVWLLGAAAYDRSRQVVFNGVARTLRPGELVTGRKKLARELGISESKVERILSLFREYGIIEQESSTRGRLLRIVDWKRYQEGAYPPLPDEEEEVETSPSTEGGGSGASTPSKGTSKTKSTSSSKVAKEVSPTRASVANASPSTNAQQSLPLSPHLQSIIDHLQAGNRKVSPPSPSPQKQASTPPPSNDYKQMMHSSPQGSHPSIQEVKGFIEQEKLLVSAEVWYNYYASVGWKIGKRRMTGKSWQNSLKTWHWRETEKRKHQTQGGGAYNSSRGASYSNHREWLHERERASLRVNDYFSSAVRGFSPYDNPEKLWE